MIDHQKYPRKEGQKRIDKETADLFRVFNKELRMQKKMLKGAVLKGAQNKIIQNNQES